MEVRACFLPLSFGCEGPRLTCFPLSLSRVDSFHGQKRAKMDIDGQDKADGDADDEEEDGDGLDSRCTPWIQFLVVLSSRPDVVRVQRRCDLDGFTTSGRWADPTECSSRAARRRGCLRTGVTCVSTR